MKHLKALTAERLKENKGGDGDGGGDGDSWLNGRGPSTRSVRRIRRRRRRRRHVVMMRRW